MDVQLTIQDNQSGTVYEATSLLKKATWSGQMAGQPGRLELDLLRDGVLSFYEGSPVKLVVDGHNLFSGWVFSKSRNDEHTTTATCFDQLRYLKNSENYLFEEVTASDIFTRICGDFQLKSRVVHPSSHILPAKIYSNQTLGHILQDSLDLTREDTGKEYFLRDNGGSLEFLDAAQTKTGLVVGEGSLMQSYRYSTSIDGDTYNRIKLVKDSGETLQREIHTEEDGNTIARWGILQMLDVVEENLNQAQLKERASSLLKQKNRVERTLSLRALGDFRALPGNSIWVETALDDMQLSRHMLVRSCTHTIENEMHTMDLELEVVEE